jgi:hypothetical protein
LELDVADRIEAQRVLFDLNTNHRRVLAFDDPVQAFLCAHGRTQTSLRKLGLYEGEAPSLRLSPLGVAARALILERLRRRTPPPAALPPKDATPPPSNESKVADRLAHAIARMCCRGGDPAPELLARYQAAMRAAGRSP